MLNALIETALRNRFLVLMGTLLVAGMGVYSALNLPIDAVPDLTNVQVQVITEAPALEPAGGRDAALVPGRGGDERPAQRRADPLDLQVRDLGRDDRLPRGDRHLPGPPARRRAARPGRPTAIPKGYGTPTLGPISTALGEIYQFQVKGKGVHARWSSGRSSTGSSSYQLRGVPGVTEINSQGGELKTYQVEVDPDKLEPVPACR